MNILFWNVHRNKQINNMLAELIFEKKSDVIGLAEYEGDIGNLLSLLNQGESSYYAYPMIGCTRVQVVSKIKPLKKNLGPGEEYYTIWRFPYHRGRKINIAFVHFFYNPMWNILGDSKSPTGSYYYRKSVLDCLFWNTLDQVCVRPCLIDEFDINDLEYVVKIGQISLLVNNVPNKSISDHLPLCFKLKEE